MRFKNESGNLKVDSEGWLTYSFEQPSQNLNLHSQFSQHIGPKLNPDQKNKMFQLLLRFESLFGSIPTTTDALEHQVENSEVVFCRP